MGACPELLTMVLEMAQALGMSGTAATYRDMTYASSMVITT